MKQAIFLCSNATGCKFMRQNVAGSLIADPEISLVALVFI